MTRRILKRIRITEQSIVNRPAQEPATVAIVKNAADGGGDNNMTATTPQGPTKEQFEELLEKLNQTSKLAVMSDAERAFYAGLSADEQPKFLAKSADERATAMKPVDASVVYKADDGRVFTKADDQRIVAEVQRADLLAKQVKESQETLRKAAVSALSEKILKNYGGESTSKQALADAVYSLPEAVRKGVEAMLLAGNELLAKLQSPQGGTGAEGESDAGEKLHKMAEEHALKHNITFEKAYKAVLETETGRALYTQYRNENQ